MTTTEIGPTGKSKNCTVWADYESQTAGTPTSKLCNGGQYEGKYWYPCASKYDCRDATEAAKREEAAKYHLPQYPVMGQPGTLMGPALASPAAAPRVPTSNPTPFMSALAGRPVAPQVSAAVPGPVAPLHAAPGAAVPVVPPPAYPVAMQAPHVYHPQHATIGVTPTFLPLEGENVWGRLGKNIGQGMIGSFGYQIASLANAVDFFGRR